MSTQTMAFLDTAEKMGVIIVPEDREFQIEKDEDVNTQNLVLNNSPDNKNFVTQLEIS